MMTKGLGKPYPTDPVWWNHLGTTDLLWIQASSGLHRWIQMYLGLFNMSISKDSKKKTPFWRVSQKRKLSKTPCFLRSRWLLEKIISRKYWILHVEHPPDVKLNRVCIGQILEFPYSPLRLFSHSAVSLYYCRPLKEMYSLSFPVSLIWLPLRKFLASAHPVLVRALTLYFSWHWTFSIWTWTLVSKNWKKEAQLVSIFLLVPFFFLFHVLTYLFLWLQCSDTEEAFLSDCFVLTLRGLSKTESLNLWYFTYFR